MKIKNGISLYNYAKTLIPGGTTLFSKRSELYLPYKWPAYFTKAKRINVWDLKEINTWICFVLLEQVYWDIAMPK